MTARAANTGDKSNAQAARILLERIKLRRGDLEAAILTRIQSDGAPTDVADPEYAEGLRGAVPVSLDYCLGAIERGEANPPPIPTALRSQARVAARNGVALDVVLRRYLAGYTLFGDFLIEEAEAAGLLRRGGDLQRLLRPLAAGFDRLMAAVSEEYRREASAHVRSAEHRRSELIDRLLAGEPLEGSELDYDLAAHHLGAIVKGASAEALRELSTSLESRLLSLDREDGVVWAWLGRRRPIDPQHAIRLFSSNCPSGTRLAFGEPALGPAGWRLTHRQARAAMPIALRGPDRMVRYADVALLSAALRDDLLAGSLRQCLAPLKAERNGSSVFCQTLRAYFDAERNISSAAMALGVNRNTVASRLRVIEERIGRPLRNCGAELETALRLDGIETS